MLALNGDHDGGLLVKLPVLSQPPGPGDSWSRAAWLALALVEFTAQGRPHSTQRMFYNMRLRYDRFNSVTDLLTYRATTRGPSGPKNSVEK